MASEENQPTVPETGERQPVNDELNSKIRKIRRKGKKLGLNDDEIQSLFLSMHQNETSSLSLWKLKLKLQLRKHFTNTPVKRQMIKSSFLAVAVAIVALILSSPSLPEMKEYMVKNFVEEQCLVANTVFFTELLRHSVPCSMCQNLTEVPVVSNISKEEFEKKYAHTGVPVLIKNAISDWGALETFSYDYLKGLYTESKGALDFVEENCQFFGYKTEFASLSEVFEMSEDRAAMKDGTKPWYIGWSNCESSQTEVGKILRSQYKRPYFLPNDSSTANIEWIFIGGPGNGANMHIDYVEKPSWQAQVSGTKTWTLEPTPECESVCWPLQVTVGKGDMIVLETNIWYHKTEVNRGEISITIGAEYD